jgi:hypothetical protein
VLLRIALAQNKGAGYFRDLTFGFRSGTKPWHNGVLETVETLGEPRFLRKKSPAPTSVSGNQMGDGVFENLRGKQEQDKDNIERLEVRN